VKRRRLDLNGSVVLVTGGARGIGLATAQMAARRGARIVLLDSDGDEAEARARELPTEALALEADVTKRKEVDRAVEQALERFRVIDVVMANAGIAPPPHTVLSVDRRDFERVLDVNLQGVWHTVRAALPQVVERRGHLVLVSSIYAALTGVLAAPYAMSKAAVEQLGRALRVELAAHDTTVSVAYFGFVETGLVREAFAPPAVEKLREALPGWLTEPIPVDRAAQATITGIERRSPRIMAPRWVPAMLAARGLLSVLDSRFANDDTVREAVALAEKPIT
jgi:NAD(P)-dependent dehydrogenase (short-subunit alcohol dehydrogenase family)